VAAVAVAALVLAAVAGFWAAPGAPGRGSLASERVFIAEPDRTGLFRTDGQAVTEPSDLSGDGYLKRPSVTSDGWAVYVHDGQAYRVPPSGRGGAQPVGTADNVFPASAGAVGLEVDHLLGPATIEYLAPDGRPEPATTWPDQIPNGTRAVAGLDDGLLLATSPGTPSGLFQLDLLTSRGITQIVGAAGVLIAAHGVTVAVSICEGGPSDCALNLVDSARDTSRTVNPPAGHGSFAQGGSFSPDGSLLATFVPDANSALHLVLIDTRTGAALLIGPPLSTADPIGAATWSSDGRWLFYGPPDGGLYAQQVTRDAPIGPPRPLPMRASYDIVGL
jgi:hypothetical protein